MLLANAQFVGLLGISHHTPLTVCLRLTLLAGQLIHPHQCAATVKAHGVQVEVQSGSGVVELTLGSYEVLSQFVLDFSLQQVIVLSLSADMFHDSSCPCTVCMSMFILQWMVNLTHFAGGRLNAALRENTGISAAANSSTTVMSSWHIEPAGSLIDRQLLSVAA